MDPNQSKTTEETTQSSQGDNQQTVSTRVSSGPDRVLEEQSSRIMTPGGTTYRREQQIGATPEAARQSARKHELYWAHQVIWYVLGFIEIVLFLRFFLKLAGANPESGFVNFVYALSQPFAGPFLETFRATAGTGAETTSFFEWSTLVAAAIYALIAWGLLKLMKFGKPAQTQEVEDTLRQS